MNNNQITTGRRIVVVANETVESRLLHDLIRDSAEDVAKTRVLVVAPALNTRLRHWLSDSDSAREAARDRLRRCVAGLAETGIDVDGMIGDADPLQATADALHVFGADLVVVATHPEGRSNWLARCLVERVRERFALPVLHVVVDAEERTEYLPVGDGVHPAPLVTAA